MVSTEVTLDGKPLPHMIQWRGGFGDLTIANPSGSQRTLYFDVTQNKLVEQPPKAAAKGPVATGGNFSFAGIADTYFAGVFLPEGSSSVQMLTFEDTVKTPARSERRTPLSGVAVGTGGANRFEALRRTQRYRPAASASIPSSSRWWTSAGWPSSPSRCS